jgi:hypothetical protein
VANYVYLTKKFLAHRFATGPVDLSDLKAFQVVGSVQRLAPSLSRKRAKVMSSALRSFLPIRAVSGLHPIGSRRLPALRGRLVRRVDSKRLVNRASQPSTGQLQWEECQRSAQLHDPVAVGTPWAASR